MVSENFLFDNIKTILIFVFITLSALSCANPVYYGPPLKVNAQLGVMEKQEEKLTKDNKSIDKWSSQIIYKPMSPLENDLKNILDSYWKDTDDKIDANEYTSELPTKLMKIKNGYSNSILDSYIKHKEETTEQSFNDRVHMETNVIEDHKFHTEMDNVENVDDREFVNRSSILTKANFSYYHPVHKKYYNISSNNVPKPVSLQYDSTTSLNHIKPLNTLHAGSMSSNKDMAYNKNTNHYDKLDGKPSNNSNKSSYKTTQVPFKPTGGSHSTITAFPFYPTKKTAHYATVGNSFGPQKPLFGHKPSVFESFTKKSNNRIPHKVTHKTTHNNLSVSPQTSSNQYTHYRPPKPPVHSNISPTGHIPSNNHPPFWSQITNNLQTTIPNHISNTLPPASYKPVYLHTTSRPSKPGAISHTFSYKPTSTTSSIGIEVNKPTSIEMSIKPLYKPTYRPVVAETETQQVIEPPSLVEEIILPQEVAVIEQTVATFVEQSVEPVTDPANIPINSLEDVDRLLVLVMQEFVGLYEHVISPFMNEMGNLLFGKSGENPVSLFIIFGLPVMTAALSAIGVGTVAIVAAAWIFPLITLLFVPQLQ